MIIRGWDVTRSIPRVDAVCSECPDSRHETQGGIEWLK